MNALEIAKEHMRRLQESTVQTEARSWAVKLQSVDGVLEDSPEFKRLRFAGFLVSVAGEAEFRFGALSSIIIERDGEQWHAYRVRWHPEIGRMQTYRTLHKGTYAATVRKACEMVDWMARKRKEEEK